ncbi:MAG: hypothetical protein Q9170_007023, partial [Blastenia crenularia]
MGKVRPSITGGRFTLDIATDFLLGRSVDSLTNADSSFAQAFNEVLRVQRLKTITGPLGWLIPRQNFRRGLKAMDSYIEPLIQDTLRFSCKGSIADGIGVAHQTFLQSLATVTKDRKVIRDQIINILLAGRDATAGILSFLFRGLSANPTVYAKLRAEIIFKIDPVKLPYADLNNLSYLRHVINETLRLYPSVPVNVRVSLADTTLPRGGGPDGLSPVGIPKNTPIVH